MPVSESKRRNNDKWDRENMSTLGCRMLKSEADAFREYCRERGQTVSETLAAFVRSCTGRDDRKSRGEGCRPVPGLGGCFQLPRGDRGAVAAPMNNKNCRGRCVVHRLRLSFWPGGGADMFPPLNNNRGVRLVRSVTLRRGFPARSRGLTVCERVRVTSWASCGGFPRDIMKLPL